jgi:hypothetical protein
VGIVSGRPAGAEGEVRREPERGAGGVQTQRRPEGGLEGDEWAKLNVSPRGEKSANAGVLFSCGRHRLDHMPPYQIIRFEQPVGSGVTNAMWASVRAVLKRNSQDEPYCVPNELICGLLGQFLGLPVPPCGLFVEPRNPSVLSFGTMNFNLGGDNLPPADPDDCFTAYADPTHPRPDAVVGVLLFDVWVLNADRHPRNLALDDSVTPAQLHVFDHSHAVFGQEGAARLHRLREELGIAGLTASGNRHCLIDVVRSTAWFRFWLDRFLSVPRFVIADAVDRARSSRLITAEEAGAAVEILWFRRERLADRLKEHRDQFPNIPDIEWEAL